MTALPRKLHLRAGLEQLARVSSLLDLAARRAGLAVERRAGMEEAVRTAFLDALTPKTAFGAGDQLDVEVSWCSSWIAVSLSHSSEDLERRFRLRSPDVPMDGFVVDRVSFLRTPRGSSLRLEVWIGGCPKSRVEVA